MPTELTPTQNDLLARAEAQADRSAEFQFQLTKIQDDTNNKASVEKTKQKASQATAVQ